MPSQKPFRIPESKRFWQVIVDKELHLKFKLECVKRQVSMNEQVEQLIREFLSGKQKRQP
jgi:hypothetical protein